MKLNIIVDIIETNLKEYFLNFGDTKTSILHWQEDYLYITVNSKLYLLVVKLYTTDLLIRLENKPTIIDKDYNSYYQINIKDERYMAIVKVIKSTLIECLNHKNRTSFKNVYFTDEYIQKKINKLIPYEKQYILKNLL